MAPGILASAGKDVILRGCHLHSPFSILLSTMADASYEMLYPELSGSQFGVRAPKLSACGRSVSAFELPDLLTSLRKTP